MSFRLPQNLSSTIEHDMAASPLEREVLAEKAASLAAAGRMVEKRLARLATDRGESAVRAAADAVYALIVQRELCGLKGHQAVLEDYAVPRDVIARIGAQPSAGSA